MEIIKKFDLFLESLITSLNFSNILDYLNYKKNNKVAIFLNQIRSGEYYNTDEDINYLSSAMEDNMITYLSKNKRVDDWEENMTSSQRTSIRVGRGIKRIYEKVKPILSVKINDTANIVESKRDSNNYYIDIKSEHLFIYFDSDDLQRIDEGKEVEIKLKIEGVEYNFKFLHFESASTSSLLISSDNFINCPKS